MIDWRMAPIVGTVVFGRHPVALLPRGVRSGVAV
jgi:hypothetical protein